MGVPGWMALCAWFLCWTVLAWLSMGLLQKVRPGERVPMRRLANGAPAWRVSPGFAAVFTPALAFAVGVITIVISYLYGGGRAPLMNVLLPLIFIFAHWTHVTMAVKVLEKERNG
jgi:hypothetical protein